MVLAEYQKHQIRQIMVYEETEIKVEQSIPNDEPLKTTVKKSSAKTVFAKTIVAKSPMFRQEREPVSAGSILTPVPQPQEQPKKAQINEAINPDVVLPDIDVQDSEPQISIKVEKLSSPITEPIVHEEAVLTTSNQDLEIVYGNEALLSEADAAVIIDMAEVGAWEHEEVIFDDEVLETFADLMVLLEVEEETSPTIDTGINENLVQDVMVALDPEAGESIVTNLFEEFIADEGRPEVVTDIETIIAGANKQPLEETLVQVSFSLVETSSQDYDLSNLESVLKDVMEELGQDSTDSVIEGAEQVITPELTQKLLVLLRAVGYEDPREVLVDFVSQHSLEFLLQAIRYLYQLLDDDRRELSPRLSVNLSSLRADDALGARVGRAILYHFFGENTVTLASS